ncbi:hypothetical protein [Gordonia soli]|nr:hypothetical protein [Gordonia soli]
MENDTKRRPKTVGDTIGRQEDDGKVTFRRIDGVRRDRYGLVVFSTAVR